MNNKYFEREKNKYIVIENETDISIVESDSDIEEILNLENDIELLENDLENVNKEILNASINLKSKNNINKIFLFFGTAFVLTTLILNIFAINEIIYILLGSYLTTNLLITAVIGTKKKNEDTRYKNSLKRQVLLAEIDANNIKLDNKKKISNYKKENVINKINNEYSEINKEIENNKVKKLILSKPNER